MNGARNRRRVRGSAWVGALVMLAVGVGVGAWLGFRPWRKSGPSPVGMRLSEVRRVDLSVTLRAGGLVESGKNTLVECELENLQFRSQGHELNVGGSSTILSLIPDGSVVKKGDVLAELDSSDYEELVRQQQIKVEETRSAKLQAELTVQVAEMAVKEFRDGIRRQDDQDYRGQIALAESEVQRATDRLAWSSRMKEKGYASDGQLASERSVLQKALFNLRRLRSEFDHFHRFTAPITLITLVSDVEAARSTLGFQTLRLNRNEERLEHYRKQVELCTVRAPHDGFAIYAVNERANEPRIEEGSVVRQKQDLFYLPDLSDMEVRTVLNESVVDRVHDGMLARVTIESLPGRILEGHVLFVHPFPLVARGMNGSDVKNYVGMVQLDSVPNGLRPGMSAEVQIVTDTRTDALVIPTEALAVEGGHDVCFVASEDRVERREVTVATATHDLLEVTEGLAEGEQVVLDPARYQLTSAPVAEAPGEEVPSPASPIH
jgi:HlyD family secretion protein